jgi:hypothetical protein
MLVFIRPMAPIVALQLLGCSLEEPPAAGTDAGAIDSTGVGREDTALPVADTREPDTRPADTGCELGGHTNCNPRTNCGCPEKCDWWFMSSEAYEGPKCTKVGSAGTGAACTFGTDCDASHACFFGQCKKKTCGVASDCGPTDKWRCVAVPAGSTFTDGGVSEGGNVCANRCDVADPFVCGFSGAGCVAELVGASLITTCTNMGTKTAGQECSWDRDCSPGHFCSASTGSTTKYCYRWCKLTASPTDCPTGKTCKSFSSGPTTINGTAYGYCGT